MDDAHCAKIQPMLTVAPSDQHNSTRLIIALQYSNAYERYLLRKEL